MTNPPPTPAPSEPDVELMALSTPEEVAQAAVEWWLDQWFDEAAPNQPRPLSMALSGGRIAQTFFVHAAEAITSRGSAFETSHFFWADERCVPPEDSQSNYQLALRYLLGPLEIPESSIHRLTGEREPGQAAQAAISELHQFIDIKDEKGCPILDIVFLGMGEDGHIASLFPGGPELGHEPGIIYPVVASKPPPQRLTMSYTLLSSAREVVVLASGHGKEKALKESLEGEGKTPLGRLLQCRSKTLILTDIVH